MRVLSYFKSPTLIVALAALITAGTALADNDRGGRGNRGGGDSGSSRSSSGGGGGSSSMRSSNSGSSGSSSRSFSGGGGDRSSSRSFSGGSGGNNSSSSRSLSSGSGGDRSIRSFSSGGDQSSRSISSGSISGGSTRIMSDGSRGDSSGVRTFQPTDSGSSRSFSGFSGANNKGIVTSQSGQSTTKSFQGGPTQSSFNKGDGGSNVARTPSNSVLGGKSAIGSGQLGNNQSPNKTSGDVQRFQSGQVQSNQGGQNYQTRRATDGEVRNFLNLRGNDAAQLAENDKGNGGNKGRGGDGGRDSSNRDEKNNAFSNLGGRSGGDNNRLKLDNNQGDHKNGLDSKSLVTGDRRGDNGDRDGKHDGHDGDKSKGPGGQNSGNFGNRDKDDHNGPSHNGRDQKFRGSDVAKTEFNQWNNAWKGKNNDGRDHRDWSGKWKDGDRFDVANNIRRDWHGRRDHDDYPFRGGWWGNHHGHGWGFWDDYAFHHRRPYYWWGWTTGPLLTSWCNFGWNSPYYWDYGPGEYIYCNDGIVYVNGNWYQPAPVFYQQTVRLIDQAPLLAPDVAAQLEWLPLGVFAITPDGLNEANVLVQLAVTKDGVIGGTVLDQTGNATFTVQGTVDKNTQRAVWSYTNEKNIRVVMETSVNNLTQNESTGLVHFGPNDQRVIELVRLQEPSGTPGDLPLPLQAQ